MIGFQHGLGDVARAEEGADTVSLSKNQLYDRLLATHFLPPFLSRGVTRDYLLKVLSNEVFSVTHNIIKHFEVDLDKSHTNKTFTPNNSFVVKKLNILLEQKGQRQLGFDQNEVPESSWLYRVARFIDQTNLLEIFERAVRPEPPATANSRPIEKTYHGRVFASRYFFENPNVRSSKKIWESVRAISDAYKSLQSMIICDETLSHELEETRRRTTQMHTTLNDLVGKCAFTYSVIFNPNIRPEIVMQGGAQYTNEMKETINRASKLYFLFTQYLIHLLYRHYPTGH